MILKSIRLRGFKGLRGLGIPEVFLDLSTLPEEGLVAVCGVNGAGKTTLLDNLHPYRLQPFKIRKAKDWSPGAFNQYEQCYGSDACKEFVFEMGGHEYRELLLIDADRRKQEAYLYRRDGVHWVAINDGKVKTYDEEIEKVCGSPSLFFTSVFRCQGAKNLSDYTRGNIMAIISELLNIDHIKEQSEKCRAVVTGLSSKLETLRGQVASLTLEANAATELLDSIGLLETELSTNKLGLGAARNDLDAVRVTISGIREKIAAQESETARKALLETQLTEEDGRKAAARQAVDDALASLDRRISTLKTSHDGFLANLTTRASRLDQDAKTDLDAIRRRRSTAQESHDTWLGDINSRIQRANHIVTGAGKIRDHVKAEAFLQDMVAADKARLPGLEQERQAALFADNRHTEDTRVLRTRLDNCQKSAGNLKGIDCTPDESGWVKSSCRLIAGAVADRDAIAALEAEIATMEANTVARDALAKADADLAACREAIVFNEAALAEVVKFTRLLPELESAEANLAAWQKEVEDRAAQLKVDLAALDQELVAREERLQADLKALETERETQTSQFSTDQQALASERLQVETKWQGDASAFDERLAAIRQELAAFPPATTNLQELLRTSSQQETELVRSVEGYERRIREVELQIAAQQTKLQAAQQKGADAQKLQPQLDQYAALIARFSLLQRACSNDGIISLELDDASPSIAALVNDLLRACYGSRFTVRLDTQTAKQDGDMKDDFAIIVFDSETGEEASITEKSGGQTTIIEDAITRGICLYNIHRSDRVYGTLYSDERDGALDPDRKLEFLKVKREALRLGTHSREFFISQTPDLVEMADARIMLAPGGARIC